MKSLRPSKRIYEPPAILLTDLAFNLVIFFVVCASAEPATGRKQAMPRGSKDPNAAAQTAQNIEVLLTRETVRINGATVSLEDFKDKLRPMLAGKTKIEERMVVVKTEAPKDTPYHRWIRITTLIEQAGGVVVLQTEEEVLK